MATASPSHPRRQYSSLLRVTTAGSVDDGKSTLIGRLLYESNALLDDQLASTRRGGDEPDLSLVTDGLKAEREQGITIDVAYKYFASSHRKFILADAPGHLQYTRNMVTAASRADVGIILIDARHGVVEQTRRHAYLLHLLDVTHVIVAINKIDLIDYDRSRILRIAAEFRQLAWVAAHQSLHIVPLSALVGDNISASSSRTPWYHGPSLRTLLDSLPASTDLAEELVRKSADTAFYVPVQQVIRDGQSRLAAGTLQGASLEVGGEVQLLPSQELSHVAALWVNGEPASAARPGDAVAIALSDERDIGRGTLVVSAAMRWSPCLAVRSQLVWFDHEPLQPDRRYHLRLGTQTARVEVKAIDHLFDLIALEPRSAVGVTLAMNDIALVSLEFSKPIYARAFAADKAAGAFILIDPQTHRTVAAGMIESIESKVDATLDAQTRALGLTVVSRFEPGPASAQSSALKTRSLRVPKELLRVNHLETQIDLIKTMEGAGWSCVVEDGPEAQALLERWMRS
ncbi:MAG: GTP-binding protein [Proteobacteria bacterium]|nr:GTP-binding protein [Pseudomonadota bacterium]